MTLPARSRQKIESKWGPDGWESLQLLGSGLSEFGFEGPLSLGEPGFLSYCHDSSPAIRVIASISRCGADAQGTGLFDAPLSVWSATIFQLTETHDPWYPVGAGYASWHRGYVACWAGRLSHLKWAAARSAVNPAWAMTAAGVMTWLADFKTLVMPTLSRLHADSELARFLECARTYQRPAWVLSDSPGIKIWTLSSAR